MIEGFDTKTRMLTTDDDDRSYWTELAKFSIL